MIHRSLRTSLSIAAVTSVALVGCQTETRQASPGALPSSEVASDVGPRLNASTYFAHGHLLERQGDYDTAIKQYEKALELSPQFVSARNRLGITLNKLGRHADATAHFRKALKQEPGEAYLYNNLGFSLYLQGNFEEAAKNLHHALEINPDYNRARMNLGVVLARLGEYDDAVQEFVLVTGQADAFYNLGVIQTEMGELALAARSLERALSLDPELDGARQQLHLIARLAAERQEEAAADPTHQPEKVVATKLQPTSPAKKPAGKRRPRQPRLTTRPPALPPKAIAWQRALVEAIASSVNARLLPPPFIAAPQGDLPTPPMGPPAPGEFDDLSQKAGPVLNDDVSDDGNDAPPQAAPSPLGTVLPPSWEIPSHFDAWSGVMHEVFAGLILPPMSDPQALPAPEQADGAENSP